MCVDTPIHPSIYPCSKPSVRVSSQKFTPSEHPSIHRSSLKPPDEVDWLILFCGGDASISHLLPRRTRRNPKAQKLPREAGGKIVSPTFRLLCCYRGETTKESA